MSSSLVGQSALVTGSTSGIGAAIARALSEAGAFVVVSGRDAARGQAVVEELVAGRAAFVRADLGAGSDGVIALADEAEAAAGGRIDILVNNAAKLIAPSPTSELTDELITRAFAVNVSAPIRLTGLLAPRMAARGGGAVINIGSINGLVGMAQSALYSSTKTALHSLTRSWAAEFARSGVRVNTVAPGPSETDRNIGLADHLAPLLAQSPSGRMSTLAEIGAAVVFLAGSDVPNLHGATIVIDGGFSIV